MLTCDQAGSRIDNKAIKENAKARMGRYASGVIRFCKGKLGALRRHRQVIRSVDLVHDLVTPEVIDERVSRLHLMQRAVYRRRLKQGAQFHETMAGAAGVKSVKSDDVFSVAIERSPTVKSDRYNTTVVTSAYCLHFKAEQISLLVAGVHLFHDHFYFIERQLRRHNIILVRKDVPNVVYRFRTGGKIALLVEHAVYHPIDRHATFSQRFHNRRAD